MRAVVPFVVLATACSGSYEQVSRGSAYNEELKACSLAAQAMRGSSPRLPGVRCPEIEARLATLKPFRSVFWLADVGAVTHELVIDYLCLTPHWTPVVVQGNGMKVVHVGSEDRDEKKMLSSTTAPADVEAIARRELFRLVPRAKDVHVHHQRSHRPLTVWEFQRVGPAEYVSVLSHWDANSDLSALEEFPSAPRSSHTDKPLLLSCEGEWFDFESEHRPDPVPIVPLALARRPQSPGSRILEPVASELSADFERRLLAVARESVSPKSAERTDTRDSVESERASSLLPEREQYAEMWVGLVARPYQWPTGPARALFRFETTTLVFSGIDERRTLQFAGRSIEVRVSVAPLEVPSADRVDLAAAVPLVMELWFEREGSTLFHERYGATLHAVLDRGRAMTSGMTSQTHRQLGKSWTDDDGRDAGVTQVEIPAVGGEATLRLSGIMPWNGTEDGS